MKSRKAGLAKVFVQLSLVVSLGGAVVAPVALAQDSMGDPNVSMTVFHAITSPNGQQYYLNQYGQAVALPGAGVQGNDVAIYQGTHGGTWYVDRNGQQVEMSAPPAAYSGYAQYQSPYGQGYGQQPPYGAPYGQAYGTSPYYGQQQQTQPNINITNAPSDDASTGSGSGSNSGSSGGSSALATGLGAGVGTMLGSMTGTMLGNAMTGYGVPYGTPMYGGGYGGGSPYYYGAGGRQVTVNNTNDPTFNQWNNQHKWYQNQVNNHHFYPGQDHGFPPPGQNNGRLYSGNPQDQSNFQQKKDQDQQQQRQGDRAQRDGGDKGGGGFLGHREGGGREGGGEGGFGGRREGGGFGGRRR